MPPSSEIQVHLGDCLPILQKMQSGMADLAYFDPPFFTQKVHRLGPRDRSKEFSFEDLWSSQKEYGTFLSSGCTRRTGWFRATDRSSSSATGMRFTLCACYLMRSSALTIFVRKSSGIIAGGPTPSAGYCRLIRPFSTTRKLVNTLSTRCGPSTLRRQMLTRFFSADPATTSTSQSTTEMTMVTWSQTAQNAGFHLATFGTFLS